MGVEGIEPPPSGSSDFDLLKIKIHRFDFYLRANPYENSGSKKDVFRNQVYDGGWGLNRDFAHSLHGPEKSETCNRHFISNSICKKKRRTKILNTPLKRI